MNERVTIVGPGRMGLALGSALWERRAVEWLTFFGRAPEPPPHPLFEADGVSYRMSPHTVPAGTTILVLAVPDHALRDIAVDVADAGPAPPGCAALHLAGAFSAEVLMPLHARGYAAGSMHPLQAIADAWSGGDRLLGSAFAVAGEPTALAAGRRLVSALGGRALVIPAARRGTYHAAATLASNHLVALTAAAVRLLQQAGAGESDALEALLPLMRGTLENLEQLGVATAHTGPIVRGDVDTVRLHLSRLSAEDRSLYCALGREALRLARAAGLDERRSAEIESLLESD